MSLDLFKNLQIDEVIRTYHESNPLRQNTIFVLSLRVWFEYECDCAELYKLLTSEEIDNSYFRYFDIELVTDNTIKLDSWMNKMSTILSKYKNSIKLDKQFRVDEESSRPNIMTVTYTGLPVYKKLVGDGSKWV